MTPVSAARQNNATHLYRPEIDGLRAVAVVPVVLFHFHVPGFRGGFVGVDVFFVISGFLITQILADGRGAARLASFYTRRIKRIFPALFAMLALVSITAVIVLFPADLARYGNSLLATSLFAANFEFWREAGYFDVIGEEKPLLHLWSIAVEEQFYLLFPALLALANRRMQALTISAVILVMSFVYSVWAVAHDPSADFYLLPGRAWELMLGAVLALGAIPVIARRAVRECFVASGLALVAAATVFYSSDTPFPGTAALVPCLGAALVLAGTGNGATLGAALLATRPFVFVGRISYSLYLWHWPVAVFARYLMYRAPTLPEAAGLIAASFALAAVSWAFVERPFREHRFAPASISLFSGAGAAMAMTAAVALVFVQSLGLPGRLRPELRAILAEEGDHEPRIDRCFGLTANDVRDGRLCRIGRMDGVPSFLLWGDSHADAILPAVSEAAARAGRTGLFIGGRSCPPLLDVETPQADCRALNSAAIARATQPQIRDVILEARWAKYAEGSPYGYEPAGRIVLRDGQGSSGAAPDNHAVFSRGLTRTVVALAGKRVVIVASVPEIGWPVPAVLARQALARDARIAPPTAAAYRDRQKFVLSTLTRLRRERGVQVLNPQEALCRGGICAVSGNGIPFYRDEHHLSVVGARTLTDLFRPIFNDSHNAGD